MLVNDRILTGRLADAVETEFSRLKPQHVVQI